MKLWFRMLYYFMTFWFQPKIDNLLDKSELQFRVWPTDLDTSVHMNNGRYLTIMDFGRLDLMMHSGLFRMVVKNGWTPVVSTSIIRFRRELRCFEPFTLETVIADWSDNHVVFEHRLVFSKGPRAGEVASYALVRAALYDRKQRAYVPIEELMRLTDTFPEKKEPSALLQAFIEAENNLHLDERTKKR